MSEKLKVVKTSKCDFYTKKDNEYWCDHCDFKVNGKVLRLKKFFRQNFFFIFSSKFDFRSEIYSDASENVQKSTDKRRVRFTRYYDKT